MKKKILSAALMLIVAFTFAGCEKSRVRTISKDKDQLSFFKGGKYEKLYKEFVDAEAGSKFAYIFVDEDDIPELLVETKTEYELYTIKDEKCEQISLYIEGACPATKGYRNSAMCYDAPEEETWTSFSFDYVPYKNKIRIHDSGLGVLNENDYYINLENGNIDLITSYENYNWTAYKDDSIVYVYEFEEARINLGYGDLVTADVAFDSIDEIDEVKAYPESNDLLEKFINGEIDAIDYYSIDGDIYKKYTDFSSVNDCENNNSKLEFINIDADIDQELLLHFDDSVIAFDVRFGKIYKLFESSTQYYDACFCNIDGVNKVAFASVDEVRKSYDLYEIDACGYIVDFSELDAFLDEDEYYMYCQKGITKDEFNSLEKQIGYKGKTNNSDEEKPATDSDAKQDELNASQGEEWKKQFIEVVDEKAEENQEYRYSLVYIDADNIPELIVDLPGNYLSIYTFSEGESILSFDKGPYGVGGCVEYCYDPSCNLLCYFSQNGPSDFSYTYLEMKDDITIREKYSIAARCLDEAGNVIDDNGNPDSWKYYYSDENGQKEISKEEFDQYNRECQSLLKGEKIKNEILEEIK